MNNHTIYILLHKNGSYFFWQSTDIPSVAGKSFEKKFLMGCDLPGSGSSSLHGRASGVIECWYTKAARLPAMQEQNTQETRFKSP